MGNKRKFKKSVGNDDEVWRIPPKSIWALPWTESKSLWAKHWYIPLSRLSIFDIWSKFFDNNRILEFVTRGSPLCSHSSETTGVPDSEQFSWAVFPTSTVSIRGWTSAESGTYEQNIFVIRFVFIPIFFYLVWDSVLIVLGFPKNNVLYIVCKCSELLAGKVYIQWLTVPLIVRLKRELRNKMKNTYNTQ